ncbi:MAG: response regulator [Solirubrobacterales bacterium]
MEKIKVLAVDDSPFSLEMIKGALNTDDIEVIGVADSGKKAIEWYQDHLPDVVTMDMTMPDMDGLACSREILSLDSQAKIIMLSSMRDESLIARGKVIGIKAFVQKPIKKDELILYIRRVFRGSEINERQETYLSQFIAALKENLQDMAGLNPELEVVRNPDDGYPSQGIAVFLGITGNDRGKVIFDVSHETGSAITRKLLNRDEVSEEDILYAMGEISNIIGGNAVSRINNLFKDGELRVSPPGILSGEKMNLFNPKLNVALINAQTEIGLFAVSVGFVGEVE